MMNILHICSNFCSNTVYAELLSELSIHANHSHTMYVPIETKRLKGTRVRGIDSSKIDNVKVIISNDFNQFYRLMYHRKRLKIAARVSRQVDINKLDLIHAHFLFSAGGVAYEFKKKHNVRYVSAIRNTDLNYFFRYAPHLRNFGLKIMNEAEKLIFISTAHKETLITKYVPEKMQHLIREKAVSIPNGINIYWFQNIYLRTERKSSNPVRLLFVGEFTKNKNTRTIFEAYRILRSRGWDARLTFVGDGPDAKSVYRFAEEFPTTISVYPWIKSKADLLEKYRAADIFVMPSIKETFGLVFLEAMSQGLPLIYTKGQGIDGYFQQGSVGFACRPYDAREIADRINDILKNYSEISINCTNAVNMFSWAKIACQHEEMYDSIQQDGQCQSK